MIYILKGVFNTKSVGRVLQGEYSITQLDNDQDIGITPPHAA